MDRLTIADRASKPKVIVGLDFGTTFSGFAYAPVSNPEKVHKFYTWPEAGGKNYCKTATSLLYAKGETPASYVLKDWGYPAINKNANLPRSQENVKKNSFGEDRTKKGKQIRSNEHDAHRGTSGSETYFLVERFKLLLAGQVQRAADIKLPKGLTAEVAIADYLRKLSELAIQVLREDLRKPIVMEDIQWCLTVPAIWEEPSKQEMKRCAERAGLVQGPHCTDKAASPHPVLIVLEPEAASLYCQRKTKLRLSDGDKFLVIDVGGGTTDIVLHQKVGPATNLEVREVSPSTGGLCGGSHVDEIFFSFLSRKIKCFRQHSEVHPQSILKIKRDWEKIKHAFDGKMHFAYQLDLPTKLAQAWEMDEESKSVAKTAAFSQSYDVIELSLEDMLSIFDPVVEKILKLIESKLIKRLKAMMLVGGFSASPYLQKRIKDAFSKRVDPILVPKEPGGAVCCGAVAYGMNGANLIISRIAKRTYGINSSRPFLRGDPIHLIIPSSFGIPLCRDIFEVYVRNGDDVPIDHCVSHDFSPVLRDQTKMEVCLYSSTSDSDPDYVHDSGVKKLGSFVVNHPSEDQLGTRPKMKVSLYFGRSTIEVQAEGENFGGETFVMPPVTFVE